MKSGTEKKQTLKLKVGKDIPYQLIGISCHENDYRLVWAINNALKMEFVRMDNLVVHNPRLKMDLEFSRYSYQDEDRYFTYRLISNRCPDGFLFQEIKNFDFLMQIVGEMPYAEIQTFSRKLKNVEIISATFILQPLKLKGITQVFQE
jgi:hypothetical protein